MARTVPQAGPHAAWTNRIICSHWPIPRSPAAAEAIAKWFIETATGPELTIEIVDEDPVLLDANPLDDVVNLRRLRGVVVRGAWLPEERLTDILARSVSR